MFERIVEIIAYVIGELKQNKKITDIDFDKLQNLGYSNSEISTAFSWLVDRIEFSESLFAPDNFTDSNSFRILHDAERELFTSEAWGQLVHLQSLGLLTGEHIENIIERALMTGTQRIDAKALKQFVAQVVFNIKNLNQPGSRLMLVGSDLIN